MDTATIVLLFLIVVVSWLLVRAAVGPGSLRSLIASMRRTMPWLLLLLVATAAEKLFNRTMPDHPYLLTLSSAAETFSELSTWLQASIPTSPWVALFGFDYVIVYILFLIAVPMYLLAAGRDGLFRRYALSLALATTALVLLHLAILSVRPGLDPSSGIGGLLYNDPFWGPLSRDLISRGNSLPSGHVTFTMATLVAIWSLPRLRYGTMAFLAITMVGVIYLGVHWPLDILAGALVGAASGLAAMVISGRWEKEVVSKRSRPGSP